MIQQAERAQAMKVESLPQKAHRVLDSLLEKIRVARLNGTATLELDVSEGGIRAVWTSTRGKEN